MEGGDGEASEAGVAGGGGGVWVEGVWACDGEGDAVTHFASGFVGEGEGEDGPGGGVVGDEMGDSAGDDAGFT